MQICTLDSYITANRLICQGFAVFLYIFSPRSGAIRMIPGSGLCRLPGFSLFRRIRRRFRLGPADIHPAPGARRLFQLRDRQPDCTVVISRRRINRFKLPKALIQIDLHPVLDAKGAYAAGALGRPEQTITGPGYEHHQYNAGGVIPRSLLFFLCGHSENSIGTLTLVRPSGSAGIRPI